MKILGSLPWENPEIEWEPFLESIACTVEERACLQSVVTAVRDQCRAINGFVEAFAAGSFGKNSLVRGRHEVDIVVSFKGPLQTEAQVEKKLEIIEKQIAKWPFVQQDTTYRTKWSLQFKVRASGGLVDVDLLPCQLVKNNPFTNKSDYNVTISSAMARLQAGFISAVVPENQKDRFNSVVRALKVWRDELFARDCFQADLKPISYLLELITLKAYQEVKSETPRALFLQAMTMIAQYRTLRIFWTKENFPAGGIYPLKSIDQYQDSRPPLILDPVNPHNNIAESFKEWEILSAYAAETLESLHYGGRLPSIALLQLCVLKSKSKPSKCPSQDTSPTEKQLAQTLQEIKMEVSSLGTSGAKKLQSGFSELSTKLSSLESKMSTLEAAARMDNYKNEIQLGKLYLTKKHTCSILPGRDASVDGSFYVDQVPVYFRMSAYKWSGDALHTTLKVALPYKWVQNDNSVHVTVKLYGKDNTVSLHQVGYSNNNLSYIKVENNSLTFKENGKVSLDFTVTLHCNRGISWNQCY
jgi:hypothetical protein